MQSTAKTRIRHFDATATYDHNGGTPRYSVSVLGEIVNFYIDTPTTKVADYLKSVSEGHNYLVGFEDATTNWWWGELGGADTYEEAQELLETLSKGNPGKGFIVPVPNR